MPREVIIKATCERCDSRGEESPAARSFVLALKEIPWIGDRLPQSASPAPQKLIEACETCAKELDEWIAVLAGHGILISELIATPHRSSGSRRSEREHERRAEPVSCTWPGCAKSLTAAGLYYHAKHTHGIMTASEPGDCPECGHYYTTAQSMGNHRANTHDYHPTDALLARLAEGPPRRRPGVRRTTPPANVPS